MALVAGRAIRVVRAHRETNARSPRHRSSAQGREPRRRHRVALRSARAGAVAVARADARADAAEALRSTAFAVAAALAEPVRLSASLRRRATGVRAERRHYDGDDPSQGR